MTTEEYNIKIKELRKERDFHEKEAYRLREQMDILVDSINKSYYDWMIGKYIKIDRRDNGGYLEFFHVDSINTRPRGFTLYGKGFNISDINLKIDDTCTLFGESNDLETISEITEDEFYNAFDTYVSLFKEKLKDYTNYKSLGNQFEFKKSLLKNKKLYNKDILSDKVLESLKF